MVVVVSFSFVVDVKFNVFHFCLFLPCLSYLLRIKGMEYNFLFLPLLMDLNIGM